MVYLNAHPTLVGDQSAERLREEAMEVPASGGAAFRELLSRWEVWVLVVGSVAFLTLPITSQTFFPVMFNRAFHYSPAEADKMASYFWLLNLFMLPSFISAAPSPSSTTVRRPVVSATPSAIGLAQPMEPT